MIEWEQFNTIKLKEHNNAIQIQSL